MEAGGWRLDAFGWRLGLEARGSIKRGLGEQECSTSFPGGNLVDGLPPVSSALRVIYTRTVLSKIWGVFLALGAELQLSPGYHTMKSPYSRYPLRPLLSLECPENS